MKKKFTLIFAAFFLQISGANSAASNWQENQSNGAKTQFIASFYQDQNGEKKLIAGLHFKIADGWKIYGNGSEGIGLPPSFDFSGSKNYLQHEIFWPNAEIEEEKIGNESIKYSTYKNEIIIPIEIDLQKIDLPTELTLKLDYGLCKDICIPVSENFSLKISDAIDQKSLQEIQKFFPKKITTTNASHPSPNASTANYNSIFYAILLAIFGGAILNVMPCVLPVLSIKLISVIKHSDTEISRVRFAFLSTIFGILFCFIIFAAIACSIKLAGNSLGWGLQFQNPYFLIFLIVILMFFIANLLGVFEITFDQFLATILNKKISLSEERKNIFIPNFLSGILAVLLATPCSAPFLGTAISFALVENFATIFLIFFFIGIGFASPYIILFFSPKLVYFLPKPGAWMAQLKQLMAGFLAATIVWLVYVLSHNLGAMPAFLTATLAVFLLACLKIKSNFLKNLALAAVIFLTFFLPISLQKHYKTKSSAYDAIWKIFDETELRHQVALGKIVVVDITADWCITCKFNKIRVLQDKEIMAKLKGEGTVAMRGDITKPNEEIMNFLQKNNRFAIPFNAVYGPQAPSGIVLNELLTKKELLESIEKAR